MDLHSFWCLQKKSYSFCYLSIPNFGIAPCLASLLSVVAPSFTFSGYCSIDICVMIQGKKLEKNEKKIHRFNLIRQIAYVYGNREEYFHYMSNYGYTKMYLY